MTLDSRLSVLEVEHSLSFSRSPRVAQSLRATRPRQQLHSMEWIICYSGSRLSVLELELLLEKAKYATYSAAD